MTTETGADVAIVPANEASWDELQLVLGVRGEAASCQCQWFQSAPAQWREEHVEERALRLRAGTSCGDPAAGATSGLVAYLDGEPAGWCAVEPRTAYRRLRTSRVVWAGRDEDPDDGSVWAAVCFVTRKGFRRRGISRALAAAVPDWAEENGARAVEGYPLVLKPGQEMTWGELYVGSHSIFAAAGFREVSRPTARRAVMRIDFEP
ncbi:N-acetyltransferase family protein [Arthrobacter sulfonylureivorans]|uniref:GNAT family N-acetyltransferase n=1 Tax=Arthrobacter sulfonylureivorans TaxID=2486855 RepID=UPI0039E2D1C2